MGKKFSVKSIGKWLSENIIIVLIFLASVFVRITFVTCFPIPLFASSLPAAFPDV